MTTPKETGNINQIIPTNIDHKPISFHPIHTDRTLYKHVLLHVCIYVGGGLTALLIGAAYSSCSLGESGASALQDGSQDGGVAW